MALTQVGQDDFAVGVLRGVAPDVLPGIGLFGALNGFVNDDGDIYRRGGTLYASPPVGGPLTFIWTGFLNGEPKTLLATASGLFTLQLGAVVALGGPGLTRPVLPAVFADKLYLPNGAVWDGGPAVGSWAPPVSLAASGHTLHVASIMNRLVVAAGSRVAFSVADGLGTFQPDDYHDLPGGVIVKGLTPLRDTLLVFSNYGLWTITNMAYDLTDVAGNIQQALSLLTPEVSLWDEAGLAEWAGRIVAPCTDRCFLVDALSPPVAINDSIPALYMSYVREGCRPGGAKVFRNHLMLPILGADNRPVTVLACRLNRPVRGRLIYYPWTVMTGHIGGLVGADVSLLGATPQFLGAHLDGRVVDMTNLWNPSESVATDADGSAHPFDVESRDLPTGIGQANHVRRLRLRYTVQGDAPIQAGYSFGSRVQNYETASQGRSYDDLKVACVDYEGMLRGEGWTSGFTPTDLTEADRFWYRLDDAQLDEPGLDPLTWNLKAATRVRYIRARFRCEAPVAMLVLHHFDFSVRSTGHDR